MPRELGQGANKLEQFFTDGVFEVNPIGNFAGKSADAKTLEEPRNLKDDASDMDFIIAVPAIEGVISRLKADPDLVD